ncbi:hypothetical protein HAT2_00660 [Candidatus Similichlamydia laticola]|uniref:Uncharacterized protein n=1 Tax=Candidatus Similichlamydia laticola TaxID=2170265 RepID=A0A369KCJ7_9BACT|nr:hypothetical protein HAT2_00660 [Candidatus Similichlamydia laticola]
MLIWALLASPEPQPRPGGDQINWMSFLGGNGGGERPLGDIPPDGGGGDTSSGEEEDAV